MLRRQKMKPYVHVNYSIFEHDDQMKFEKIFKLDFRNRVKKKKIFQLF